MSKDYFTPVDLDGAFPAPPEEVKVPSRDPVAELAKAEAITEAKKVINEELNRVRMGVSKHVADARQFIENKTPFCIALNQLPGSANAMDALRVVVLAKQDFGDKFANFVVDTFKPIYGDK